MASVIVKEGFKVDEAVLKSVRTPKLEVKPSALNDVLPVPHVNGKHLGGEGINGLLRICNVKSTCQVMQSPPPLLLSFPADASPFCTP